VTGPTPAPTAHDLSAASRSLAELWTPAVLVDVGRLERNVAGMAWHGAALWRTVTLPPQVETSERWQVAGR
jgi:hypothetical protein